MLIGAIKANSAKRPETERSQTGADQVTDRRKRNLFGCCNFLRVLRF